MLGDDCVNIGFGFAAVPDAFRVDDNAGPLFAAIQAACVIHPCLGKLQLFYARFHVVAQLFGVFPGAAAARVSGLTPVGATENMGIEKRHEGMLGVKC